MKTNLYILTTLHFLFLSVCEKTNAQSPDWLWAKRIGGSFYDHGYSVAVDASDNVYTTGNFFSTVDFDPGAGVVNFTASVNGDIFISKLDSLGNYVWARHMGGIDEDYGNSITLDASGNVYITGYFHGTVDFNPGAGVFNLTSAGNKDIFISKFDGSGNFVWAKRIGGTGIDNGLAITVDRAGSGGVYTTGTFQGTVDFNPGGGVFNLTSAGQTNIFISKLDSLGNFVWAKQMTGTYSIGYSIAIDVSGYVYTTGSFSGTTDFDPDSSGTFNLTSASTNIFISKLDGSGNFVWAKAMEGIGNDVGLSIAPDAAGNLYTTGYFTGTADFDPDSSGTFYLTAAGINSYSFISKLDSSGNFVWAKAMGGTTFSEGRSIALDPAGSGAVYTTGAFADTADFDPGAGVFNLISVGGNWNMFISKLDSSGSFVWAKAAEGTGNAKGQSIALNASGNAYVTGFFYGSPSIIFGPITLTNAGNEDIFIAKLDTALVTGINDVSSLSMMNIYPNPATNQLTISSGQLAINSIEIYDAHGQKVYSEQLKTINRKQETTIDISKFREGIYLVQIKSEDFIETRKLIVAK